MKEQGLPADLDRDIRVMIEALSTATLYGPYLVIFPDGTIREVLEDGTIVESHINERGWPL